MNRSLATRKEFDSLLNSTFESLWNDMFRLWDVNDKRLAIAGKANYPRVNVEDHPDRVDIEAAVPGLTSDDVSVEYSDGFLTVSGKSQNDVSENKNGFIVRELHKSSFNRSFKLDESVHDVEKISAGVDKGILSVTIPKRNKEEPEQKVRKIQVR